MDAETVAVSEPGQAVVDMWRQYTKQTLSDWSEPQLVTAINKAVREAVAADRVRREDNRKAFHAATEYNGATQ